MSGYSIEERLNRIDELMFDDANADAVEDWDRRHSNGGACNPVECSAEEVVVRPEFGDATWVFVEVDDLDRWLASLREQAQLVVNAFQEALGPTIEGLLEAYRHFQGVVEPETERVCWSCNGRGQVIRRGTATRCIECGGKRKVVRR